MNQQKKKSKTIIRVLFVILGILILSLIGSIIYFYLIGDIFQQDDTQTVTCGCYYIDPQITSTCGNTKRAFKFNTSTGTINDCLASCPLTDLSTNTLYSTTQQDSYLTCSATNILSTSCNAMTITTEDDLIVTGKITPDEEITITATFDSSEYTDYKFLINNVPTEPDETVGNTISKTISDFGDSSTLQISAQAVDSTGDTVDSIICNRLIEISTTARAGITGLTFDTYTLAGRTKLESALITVGGLEDTDTIVKFSFQQTTLTMTDGFELDPGRGRITITESNLYNVSNFSEDESLSTLDSYEGDLEITVEITQDGSSLGTTTKEITFLESTDDEADTTDTDQDSTSGNDSTQDTTEGTTTTESEFSVTNTSSETCVERVSPDNTSTFTITITNNGDLTDTIESIKNKLPLGFEYVSGSSKLNGNSIADSVFVTVTDVGESQEVVWEPQASWSIDTGGVLTITFNAIAGSNSLSGDNLNEVIVTPSEIPQDPSTLRTSVELIVAQDCTSIESIPQTGIFDSTIGRILVGLAIIMIGIIIHNTNKGNQLATLIINSNTYRSAEMTSYKMFNPKKYFEEKILERRERKR